QPSMNGHHPTRRTGPRQLCPGQTKPVTPRTLPTRTLAQTALDIRDGTRQPRARVVPRHDSAPAVPALLPRGRTPTSAGGVFCLPSLLHRGAHDLAATVGPPKPAGRPKERRALGLGFASLCGSTAGIQTVDTG